MRKWFSRLLITFILAAAILASIWVGKIYFSKVAAIDDTFVTNVSENTTASRTQSGSPILGKEIPGLPEYCADKLISVSGCDGMTEITTEQGNTYRLVEIGNQCWFADNLKEIPTTDTGWYGYYDNAKEEPSPGEGLLYTWEAAMNGEAEERAQGVCPNKWHLPSECEFLQAFQLKLNAEIFLSNRVETVAYNHARKLVMEKNSENILWSSSNFPKLGLTTMISPSFGTEPTSKIFPNMSRYNAISAKCVRD